MTYHCPKNRLAGFSLLELMVVVVLLAGLMAILIPTLNSIAGADVKNEIVRMAGLMRELYNHARISGITHRINIDLDNQNYWVEAKEGDAGIIAPELGYKELMEELITKGKEAQKNPEYQHVPQYKESKDFGEKIQLGKNIVFYGAWTEDMPEVARTGIVYIYFFPKGYTQSAFVSIAQRGDEQDTAMYVALSPLTGAVSIDYSEPETKDLREEESDKEL